MKFFRIIVAVGLFFLGHGIFWLTEYLKQGPLDGTWAEFPARYSGLILMYSCFVCSACVGSGFLTFLMKED